MTIRDRLFDWGARTYVMGIVNVSPESFSGDGVDSVEAAVAQAKRLEAEGADIIDVGGMSTRPNFRELSEKEERDRAVPGGRATASAVGPPVSIHTPHSGVAMVTL